MPSQEIVYEATALFFIRLIMIAGVVVSAAMLSYLLYKIARG